MSTRTKSAIVALAVLAAILLAAKITSRTQPEFDAVCLKQHGWIETKPDARLCIVDGEIVDRFYP